MKLQPNVGEKSLPQPREKKEKMTPHDHHMQEDQKLSLHFKKTL